MKQAFALVILGALLTVGGWNVMPGKACAADGGETDPLRDGPDVGLANTTIASQTCDTQVWQTMEARARIETEREIMQNQNLIFKPDSILSYMCFDKMAGHAASSVGVLFTHTTYWEGKEIIPWGPKYGMDEAINKVVIDSLKKYQLANFPHAYMGGRGPEYMGQGNANPPPAQNVSKSSTYECGEMGKVWAAAKCANFMHTQTLAVNDGFFPYLNLKPGPGGGEPVAGYETKNDVRKYPTACSGTPITGSTWKDMYHLSRNENNFGTVDLKYQFGTPLKTAFQDVRKKIEPGACGGDPVKTGVTVILGPSSTKTQQDGVCTNPGCTFVASDGGGTCLQAGSSTGGGRGAGR